MLFQLDGLMNNAIIGPIGNSNYGNFLDIMAPGTEVLTTTLNNSYERMSGTSAASPFACGCSSFNESCRSSSL